MRIGKQPTRNLIPLYRLLGSDFTGFAKRGTYLLRVTSKGMVGGFCFDSTPGGGHDKRTLWCFVQPLFVPSEDLHFGFGAEIPKVERKTLPKTLFELREEPLVDEDPYVTIKGSYEARIARTIRVMAEDGLPRLRITMSLQGFYDSLELGKKFDSNVCEAAAFTALRLGLPDLVLEHIRLANVLGGWEKPAANDSLPNWYDPDAVRRGWEVDQLNRLNGLRDTLDESGLAGANALLDSWERSTCEAIGIEDLRWPTP